MFGVGGPIEFGLSGSLGLGFKVFNSLFVWIFDLIPYFFKFDNVFFIVKFVFGSAHNEF